MTTTRADHFQSVARAHSVPVSVFRTTCLYALRKFSTAEYGTPPKARLAEIRAAYLGRVQAQEIAA